MLVVVHNIVACPGEKKKKKAAVYVKVIKKKTLIYLRCKSKTKHCCSITKVKSKLVLVMLASILARARATRTLHNYLKPV